MTGFAGTVITLLGVSNVPPAAAAPIARGARSQSVISGRWQEVASRTLPPAGVGPLPVQIGLLGSSQYLWAVNTGTAQLADPAVTVSYSMTASTVLTAGSVQLLACIGDTATWNETTGTCAGGTTQLLASTAGVGASAPAVPTAAKALRLQVHPVSLSVATTVTVSITVTRT